MPVKIVLECSVGYSIGQTGEFACRDAHQFVSYLCPMTFEEIRKQLSAKKYAPVYYLQGDEPYYIDFIADEIESHALDEAEKSFNQTVLYGKETTIDHILENARRFPMMGEKQVVIVKEAQNIKNIESISTYVANPVPTTILVICHKYGTIDGRKKDGKALVAAIGKTGILFESKKLYENQLPDWIARLVKERGLNIQPKATVMLSEFIGNDLSRIANEIEKLAILIPAGGEITPLLIERNIGISKEFNNFELISALSKKDAVKAFQIADYFAANEKDHSIIATLISLYNFFSKVVMFHSLPDKSPKSAAGVLKVNPFFVSEYAAGAGHYTIGKSVAILGFLREYDRKAKGLGNAGTPDGELLKELLFKILM